MPVGPAGGSTRRILLRSHRDLTRHVSPTEVAQKNLIGNNSGNTIFGHAVHRVLSVQGAEISVDRARANVEQAGQINEQFDQYVIPFANAFRPSFVQALDRYTDLIEQLKIPVVIVGVGIQLNYDGTNPEYLEPIRPNIDRFMRAALERSATVGVRGEMTYKYLRSIGFSHSQVSVIGCPSLFQRGLLQVRTPEPITRNSLVTLNVSPYQPKMGPITTANVARYPRMRYVPQDVLTLRTLLFGDDPPNADTHHAEVPYRVTDPLLDSGRTDFFVDPTTWVKWLAGRDVSFGTRIHGNIASLLAGTPAVVLSHDSRTRELADYHEIPHVQLQKQPDDVDPRDLFEAADYSGFHATQEQRLQTYIDFLDQNDVRHILSGRPQDQVSVAEFDAKIDAARNKRPTTSVGAARRQVRRQRLRARRTSGALLRKVKSKG